MKNILKTTLSLITATIIFLLLITSSCDKKDEATPVTVTTTTTNSQYLGIYDCTVPYTGLSNPIAYYDTLVISTNNNVTYITNINVLGHDLIPIKISNDTFTIPYSIQSVYTSHYIIGTGTFNGTSIAIYYEDRIVSNDNLFGKIHLTYNKR